jgi:glyoxylate reductase
MRQLKVLYLPHPMNEVNVAWGRDLLTAIGDHHDLRVFDRDLPAEPQFEDVEAIVDVGGNISAEWVDIAKRAGVKFLQAQTNGLDHVEVDKIRDSGMLLAHCPGELSSVALAEGAMMFILMLAHRHGDAQRNFAAGKVFFPMGMELEDRRLGIIGFGASGQQLARRAKAFGMRILAVDIRPIEPDVLDEIQPDILTGPDALDRLMVESDFISVHLHMTTKTRHIIDERRIKLMKPTACIINVARGELIDEKALYRALLDGRIGGAGLDAFVQEPPDPTQPVYQLPNVYVTPHTVGSTDGTSRKRAFFAAENLNRYALGEAVLARVF